MANKKETILNNLLKSNLIHKHEYDRQIDILASELTKEEIKNIIKDMAV